MQWVCTHTHTNVVCTEQAIWGADWICFKGIPHRLGRQQHRRQIQWWQESTWDVSEAVFHSVWGVMTAVASSITFSIGVRGICLKHSPQHTKPPFSNPLQSQDKAILRHKEIPTSNQESPLRRSLSHISRFLKPHLALQALWVACT